MVRHPLFGPLIGLIICLAVLIFILVLTACGGGSDETGPEVLTREQFELVGSPKKSIDVLYIYDDKRDVHIWIVYNINTGGCGISVVPQYQSVK